MKAFCLLLPCLLLITCCKKYEAAPLPSRDSVINQEIDVSKFGTLDFQAILLIAGEKNPELQIIKRQYADSLNFAKTKHPFLNPEVSVGLTKGFNLDAMANKSIQPFISLGYTVPLWGKRRLVQEVENLEAALMFQKLTIIHRSVYRKLLQAFVEYEKLENSHALNISLLKEIEADLKFCSSSTVNNAVELESVKKMEVLKAEIALNIMQLNIEKNLQLGLIAETSGVSIAILKPCEFNFKLSDNLKFNNDEMIQLWLEHSVELNQLKAMYDIAEKKLELEVRKQYPDLVLDGNYEKEPGSSASFFGLSLGMELPLFDRNQKAILLAKQERDKLLLEYQLLVNKEKNKIDVALKNILLNGELKDGMQNVKDELMAKDLKFKSRDFYNDTKALSAYLDAKLKYWEAQDKINSSNVAYIQGILELENLIGCSLLVPIINKQISEKE